MKKNKNKKGFTMVELMVVLAIIAILATILVPSLMGYVRTAKETAAISEAKSIMTASSAALYTTIVQEGTSVNFNKTFTTTSGDKIQAGCITNWSIASSLKHKTDTDVGKQYDIDIAGKMMTNLDSSDLEESLYGFTGDIHNPIGEACKSFYATYKCPGVVLVYDDNGAVIMLEYFNKGVLVHYEDGNYVTTFADDDTVKFANSSKIQY